MAAGRGRTAAKAARLDARGVAEMLGAAAAADDDVCVVTGAEDALGRLILRGLQQQASGRDVTVVRVSCADPDAAATLRHACHPTLFGGATWVFVTEVEAGGDEVFTLAKNLIQQVGPQLRVVFRHNGAARGKGVIAAAQQAGARMFEVRPVATAALPAVLISHARLRGNVLTSEAAALLVESFGEDLTALLAAVDQLAADAEDQRIDGQSVRQTFVATGTEGQFEIADMVWHRNPEAALIAFRHLVARTGASSACVTVVAALSFSLRALARYVAERPSGSPWQVASALGVPPRKVEALAAQAKLWRPAQLAEATVVLATADADAKGGLGDAGALDPQQKLYALERLILKLADA